jgi:VWFA-related protein
VPPLFVAAATLALSLQGQAHPPADVPVVRLHAVVVDADGRPVEGLRAADFRVLEDGVEREIAGVRFVRAGGAAAPGEIPAQVLSRADEQAEASREGQRLFAIFLDEYHVGAGEPSVRARDAVARLVEEHLGPRDLLVIFKPLDSLLAIRLTRDREAVAAAIAAFEGRKGDYEPRSAFERNYIAGSADRIAGVRAQIAASALHALARHLGGLGGTRKTLVVVSEGFTREPRRGDELPAVDTVIRAAVQGGVAIYPIDPAGLVEDGAPRAPARAAATGGAIPGERPGPRETLRRLASETAGHAILDARDLPSGLQRIAADSSAYYEVAFTAGGRDLDARFHPVDVQVAARGIELRAVSGYWTPLPSVLTEYAERRAAEERRRPPEVPRRTSPLIRAWFGVSRGDAGRMRVSFVWEPAASAARGRGGQPPGLVAVTATTADGQPVFDGVVRALPPGTAGLGAPEGYHAVFDAPPGRLRLRMIIQDSAARALDTDVRDVPVGALAGPVALGTPEVLRARTAREFRALEKDPRAVPVAAREFSRSERLLVRVPAYAEPGPPELSARLFSRLGGAMRDVPVTAGPSADLYQTDLPLAGLAAGDYAIEIAVKTAAGASVERVAFRVIP